MPTLSRRVALCGGRAVGKSSIALRFVEESFSDSYSPTIETRYQRTLNFNGRDYELDIVDTAGQDEHTIFPGPVIVHGYMMVYSVTNRHSFRLIEVINDKILSHVGSERVPRVVVGNKTDLSERVVSTEEGVEAARRYGCSFIEVSAKTNVNDSVREAFRLLIAEIDKEMAPPAPTQEESTCVLL